MQLYKCKVRLQSSLLNEVPKINVTVPEIEVLRIVHRLGEGVGGAEPVADIERLTDPKGKPITVERTDREERERLEMLYGPALKRSKEFPTINAIFGVGTPLPTRTEGISGEAVADTPKRTTRMAAAAGGSDLGDME